MADAQAREPEVYETVIVKGDDGLVAMWAGDAGYEAQDPAIPGPRHRLLMSRVRLDPRQTRDPPLDAI